MLFVIRFTASDYSEKSAGKLRHGYDVTSGHVTDVTFGSTEQQQQQYSQSNGEEPYYILKTNNRFFFWFREPLYCNVFYVIWSLLLLSVSRKQDPHM